MMLVEQTSVPVEALPLGALRDHLRLGSGFADDALQDGVIEECLRAAMAAVEARTGKALMARVWRWSVTAWRDLGRQVLPVAPVSAVTGFAIRDMNGVAAEVEAGRWRLEPDLHRPTVVAMGLVLPTIPVGGAAEITFAGGFGPEWTDLPADLRQAVMLLAAHYYEHRHEVAMAGGLPQGVAAMIERYRNVRLFGGGGR
jgi:uncharacterized phiE125 gp8 family phage protein